MAKPRLDPDRINLMIANQTREPFQALLANLIAAEPSQEDVEEFAAKYPDRWMQAVTMAARLSGYSEKQTVQHNHLLTIQTKSDAELIAEAQEAGITIDADPVETPRDALSHDNSNNPIEIPILTDKPSERP